MIQQLSHVQLFETPWTDSRQTPLSMDFPRQDYWSGLPFSSPRASSQPGRFEECFIANETLSSEPSGCHNLFAAGGGLVTLSRPSLVTPMDCSPPGSSVYGISQARILTWVVNFMEVEILQELLKHDTET